MERDFSSIKLLEKVVQLVLPTQFISNEIAGVLETLESWKRQYNPQLEGILVNYSNVSLLSRSNKVFISRNGIIIDVKALFHLFCPKAGDVVRGKINRISRELVGCIMHDTINATIYLTEYFPDELKKLIRLERDLLFEITHFSCFRSEVRVKGKISPQCVSLMTELFLEEEALSNLIRKKLNKKKHSKRDKSKKKDKKSKTKKGHIKEKKLSHNLPNNSVQIKPEL